MKLSSYPFTPSVTSLYSVFVYWNTKVWCVFLFIFFLSYFNKQIKFIKCWINIGMTVHSLYFVVSIDAIHYDVYLVRVLWIGCLIHAKLCLSEWALLRLRQNVVPSLASPFPLEGLFCVPYTFLVCWRVLLWWWCFFSPLFTTALVGGLCNIMLVSSGLFMVYLLVIQKGLMYL